MTHTRTTLFALLIGVLAAVGILFAVPVHAEKYEYSLPGQGGNALRKMAFDGTYLWVAGGASHKIYKMDANTGSVVQTFTFASDINPYDIQVIGSDIWATDSNAVGSFPANTPFLRIINGTTQAQYAAGTDYAVQTGFYDFSSDGVYLYVITRQDTSSGHDRLMRWTIADVIGGDYSRDWECELTRTGCGTSIEQEYGDAIIYDSSTFGTPVVWVSTYKKESSGWPFYFVRAHSVLNGQIVAGPTGLGTDYDGAPYWINEASAGTVRGCGMDQDAQYLYVCTGRLWVHKVRKSDGILASYQNIGSFPLLRNGYVFGHNNDGTLSKLRANNFTSIPTQDLNLDSVNIGSNDLELTQLGSQLWMWSTYQNGILVSYLPEVNVANVSATPGSTTATITWTTDVGTSVNYVGYRNAATSDPIITTPPVGVPGETAHSVTITGLTQGATYEFSAVSEEPAFSMDDADNSTFTTTTLPDVTISNIRLSNLSQSTALINWDTNVSATTQVCYKTAAEAAFSCVAASTGLNHAKFFTTLTTGTAYDYYIIASATGYNTAQTDIMHFKTLFADINIDATDIYIKQSPTAAIAGTTAWLNWTTGGAYGGDAKTWYGQGPVDYASNLNIGVTTLNAIDCTADRERCWAVGNSGTIYRKYGYTNWEQISSGVTAALWAVTHVGKDFVWAAGDGGTILYSDDGGVTWTRQTSPFGTAQSIYGIAALTNNNLYAVTHLGSVITTASAGNTWGVQTTLQSGKALNGISFRRLSPSSNLGCIAGDNGGLWWYESITNSWNKITTSTTKNLYSCDAVFGDSYGYVAVGVQGAIYRAYGWNASTAQLLTNPIFGTATSFTNIRSYPGSRLAVTGPDGKVFYSEDYGSNWMLYNFNTLGKDLNAVYMYEPTNFEVVGVNGANFKWYRTYPSISVGPAGPETNHSMQVTGLADNTTYHYKVASQASTGQQNFTGDYTFTTQFGDSTPPDWSNPNAQIVNTCTSGSEYVTITWDGTAVDPESDVDHYELWRSINTAAYTKLTDIPVAGPHSYQDGPLNTSTAYHYKVRAVNRAGLFTESAVVSYTTGTRSFNLAWSAPTPLPPRVTVEKGTPANYTLHITRNGCMTDPVTLSYSSASPGIAAGNFTFGSEVSGDAQVTINTTGMNIGTYNNITVKGTVTGLTTQYAAGAVLIITDTTVPTTPPVITDSTVTCGASGSRSVRINWSAAQDPESGIKNYEVHRSTTAGFTPSAATKRYTTTNATTFTYLDTSVVADQTYYYIVVAVNNANLTVNSQQFTVSTFGLDCDVDTTPPGTAPSLSSSLTCGTDPVQDVVLTWTQAQDPESGIDKYEVFRGATKIYTEDVNPPADTPSHTYTDASVGPGTYSYRIDAWNSATPTPQKVSSNVINVTVSASSIKLDVKTPATASVTVASGTDALYTLELQPTGCVTDNFTLSFESYTGSPAGIASGQVSFNPAVVSVNNANATSLMTIRTTGLPPGTYRPLRVNATSPSTGLINIDQSPNVTLIIDSSTCVDGTPNLTCRATITGSEVDKPLYCDTATSPNLFDKCSICGCPTWTGNISTDRPYCNLGSEACELKCSDGTPNLTCSTITPGSYCDLSVSFDPIEDCTKCTSPTDGYCDAPNEVCNPATKQCELDDVPPDLTRCPITCNASDSSITVNWCTDEPATSGLKYGQISGVYPGWVGDGTLVTDHTVTATGLASNTTYVYRVVSDDEFGNRAESSEQQCTTTNVVDVDPPSCSGATNGITAPLDGETVSGTIPFSANVTDNVGVTQVQFRAGGVLIGTDTSAPYSVNLDTTAFSDGTLQLTITAYDAAGLTCGDEIHVTVVNDNQPPSLVGEILVEPFNAGQYVRVSWSTNEESSGWVLYGRVDQLKSTWKKVTYTTGISHQVELGPLEVGKQYGADIQACDIGGNCGFLNF